MPAKIICKLCNKDLAPASVVLGTREIMSIHQTVHRDQVIDKIKSFLRTMETGHIVTQPWLSAGRLLSELEATEKDIFRTEEDHSG